MDNLLRDLRFGFRMLAGSPGFTFVALVVLALGIGGTTAVFSVIDPVLLRPLPYPHAERIVVVGESTWRDRATLGAGSPANYLDWKTQSHAFDQLAAVRSLQANLSAGDQPERVLGVMTTANLFPLFGVTPVAGRGLLQADEQAGHDHVVVLNYALWNRGFGLDPGVVGRSILLNGEPFTVVGVMPRSFAYPDYAELWIPSPWSVPSHPLQPDEDPRALRDSHYLDVVGRLKPGVSFAQAGAELDTIAHRLATRYPDSNAQTAIRLRSLHEDLAGPQRPMLLVLAAAVGFVLLIACANVANLLLARGTARTRELSVRLALGATRARLIRQALTESALLALVAGAVGALLASWTLPALLALGPPDVMGRTAVTLSARALAATSLLSLLTGMLFGILPALHASGVDVQDGLKEGARGANLSRHSNRTRWFLVGAEVALSVILLVGAGLLIRSFTQLMQVDPGFRPERLLVFSLAPSSRQPAEQTRFYQRVLERLQALPGVQAAGAVSRLPLSGGNSTRSFGLPGKPDHYTADYRVASTDYFRALGVPLRTRRFFTPADTASSSGTRWRGGASAWCSCRSSPASRSCSPPSASMASSPTRFRSARTRSASGWLSAPGRWTSRAWSCGRRDASR